MSPASRCLLHLIRQPVLSEGTRKITTLFVACTCFVKSCPVLVMEHWPFSLQTSKIKLKSGASSTLSLRHTYCIRANWAKGERQDFGQPWRQCLDVQETRKGGAEGSEKVAGFVSLHWPDPVGITCSEQGSVILAEQNLAECVCLKVAHKAQQWSTLSHYLPQSRLQLSSGVC